MPLLVFVASLGFSRVNMFPESFWLVFVQAVMDWLTRKRLEALTVAGPVPESVQVETSMPPIQVSMGLNNLSLSIAMWAVSLGHPAVPLRGSGPRSQRSGLPCPAWASAAGTEGWRKHGSRVLSF